MVPKFGSNGNKFNVHFQTQRVELENEFEKVGLLIHDEGNPNLANMLVIHALPFQVAMDVIYRENRFTYNDA